MLFLFVYNIIALTCRPYTLYVNECSWLGAVGDTRNKGVLKLAVITVIE